MFGRDMLGYDVHGGKLLINDNGAEIVRLIFHKYVNEGKGTHTIARELLEAGIQTATYMKQWSNTVILRILRNEKYCGDLVQKKTITPNYLTHEKKYNRGEEEYVIIRDHHQPIIGRELFERAQTEMARRSPSEEQKTKHSNRYCFSGKIKCGVCGCSFVSRSKRRKDASTYKSWRCYEGVRNAGCSCPSLGDEDAKWMLREVVKSLRIDTQRIMDNLMNAISRAVHSEPHEDASRDIQKRHDQILEKKRRLLELYLGKEITKQEFGQMNAKYDAEAAILTDQLQICHRQNDVQKDYQDLLSNISSTLHNLVCGDDWDDTFYRHILD